MYCKSIEESMINRTVLKIRAELAILKAQEIVEKTMSLNIDELRSRSRLSNLVTGRILFTAIAFSTGARNVDISNHLGRNKSAVGYFIQKGNERSKFDSNYKKLEEKINLKQNKNMANIIDEIAAKAASTAVAEMTKLFIEKGIFIESDTEENFIGKADDALLAFLEARKEGGVGNLGGKELDFGIKKISPADQLK